MVSVICEMFNCTPDEAMAQDLGLVRRISDYRILESEKTQFNQDATKMKPEHNPLWLEFLESLND